MKRGRMVAMTGAALLMGAVMSACGGGDDDAASATQAPEATQPPAATQPDTTQASATDAPADTGSADCSAITPDDMAKFIVYTQVLAQITDQSQVDALRDHSFTDYTPEEFAAILVKLHAVLDGHLSGPFGDPEEALTFYGEANDMAAGMIAGTGAVPQDQLDAYAAHNQDVATVLGKQIPITATLDEVCPDLS